MSAEQSSFEQARANAAQAAQSNLHPAVQDLLAALAAAKGEEEFLGTAADLYDKKASPERNAIFAFINAETIAAGLEPVRGLIKKAAERGMLNEAARIDAEVKTMMQAYDSTLAGVRADAEALFRKQREQEERQG